LVIAAITDRAYRLRHTVSRPDANDIPEGGVQVFQVVITRANHRNLRWIAGREQHADRLRVTVEGRFRSDDPGYLAP